MELSRTVSDYLRPGSAKELEAMLAASKPGTRLIAGGTDVMIKLRSSRSPAAGKTTLVSLAGIRELSRIQRTEGGVEIGSTASLTRVASDDLLSAQRAIADAAHSVAGPSIRNTATIGGNVCNGSPSADLSVALVAADAVALLRSFDGKERRIPIAEFFLGPGKTALLGGEYLRAFFVPSPRPGSVSSFRKLGVRTVMEIAIVNLAIRLDIDSAGRCSDARIALGAVAPVPMRAESAEALLKGQALDAKTWALAAERASVAAAAEARPISDLRASAEYRRDMVKALVAEELERLSDSTRRAAPRTAAEEK